MREPSEERETSPNAAQASSLVRIVVRLDEALGVLQSSTHLLHALVRRQAACRSEVCVHWLAKVLQDTARASQRCLAQCPSARPLTGALAERHDASGGVEAEAQLAGGPDGVVQRDVSRVDVEVVCK